MIMVMNEIKNKATTYIGPTILKYLLFNNKTFKGGIPYNYPPLKGLFEKCSLLKMLFVEPKNLSLAKKNLQKKATLEYQALMQLIKTIKEAND